MTVYESLMIMLTFGLVITAIIAVLNDKNSTKK